jgi:predicted nucleic acid-binding Zn ribbon protein
LKRKRESAGLAPIGDVLKGVFEKLEADRRPAKEDIEGLWKEVAGSGAFKHSKPSALKKKILTVRVDSPAWIQDLTLRKRWLLKGLKRALGKDRITEIHFKIGEF